MIRRMSFGRANGICAAVCVAACAVAADGNLLKNGDFEHGFDHWRKPGSLWRVDDGAGYEGSKGLVWECRDASRYEYPVQYVPLEAGSAYRFSALVKVDELKKGARPSVGCEWVDSNGKWIAGAYAHPVDDNGAIKGGWVRYEGKTKPMRQAGLRGGVLCVLAKGLTGKVRFDDLSFERLPVKPVEFVCTSAYRDSASEGTLRVLASINANTNLHVATLAVKTAAGAAKTLAPVSLADDMAVFSIPVAELATGKQKMTFRLSLRAGGATVGTGEVAFERTTEASHRRVSFDSQRRMILDGKRFFPLGHYTNVMTDEDMREYMRGPHNFAIVYNSISTEQLDRWQKAGVYVAADVRRFIYGYNYNCITKGLKTADETRTALRRLYAEVGSHPALVMWYLNDEAPVGLIPNVTKTHEFLHEIDPDRATLTCLDRSNVARDFLPSYDVVAHDCYPVGNTVAVGRSRLDRVVRQMRELDLNMASMRPLWFIPQAFDWRWCYPKETLAICDKPYLRMPTRDEMSNMTWQGIACGANGIVFYCYKEISRHAKGAEYEKAWGDTCDVAIEVKSMEDVLLSDDITPDFAKGCAALPQYLPVRFYRHAGRVWMLAVNATRESMKAKLPLGSRYCDLKMKLGGGVKLLPDGRTLGLDMPPMGYAFVSFVLDAAGKVTMQNIAHRGMWDAYVPQNTVESIKRAYDSGATWVETDFYHTKAGQMVCVHDEGALRKYTECDKRIVDLTPKDIETLNLGEKGKLPKTYRIPLLGQVLAVVPKDGVLQAEIKGYSPQYADVFDAAVKSAGLTERNIVVSSFSYGSLRDFKARYPKYRCVWLVGLPRDEPFNVQKYIEKCKAANIDVFCPGCGSTRGVMTTADADAVRAAGLELRLWGVNSVDDLRQAKALGAVGFTCNHWFRAFTWADEIGGVELLR